MTRFASGAPLADESTFNRRVSGADGDAASSSQGEAGGAGDEAAAAEAEGEGEGGAAVRPFRERGQRSLAAMAAHARGRDGSAAGGGGDEALPEGGTSKQPPEAKGLKAAIRKGLLGLGISPPADAEVRTSHQ